ncbi:MAG: hypothetical protein C0412_09805 [Flavobacterium sp.]|nr:hypothetical protein [Flavobacterium sp.]
MNFSFKHISGSCKYHRKIGKVYTLKDLVPSGLCPHAYFVAYPYCLSLLYGATFSWMKKIDKNVVEASCPAPANQVVMKIWRKVIPKEKRKTKKDEDKYNIYIEVVTKLKSGDIKNSNKIYKSCKDCQKMMKKGKRFEFNKGQLPGVCPALFHQIFPYLVAISSGGRLDWQNKDGNITLPCPDNISNINFLIKKRY